MKNHKNNPNTSQGKDKVLVLNFVKYKVEKGTGKSLSELKKEYSEEELFYKGLKHITTTKKAYCIAMKIPIEAGCRYKRTLEKNGLLVQSLEKKICPYTRHFAHLISTNPDEFDNLIHTNQLKLF